MGLEAFNSSTKTALPSTNCTETKKIADQIIYFFKIYKRKPIPNELSAVTMAV